MNRLKSKIFLTLGLATAALPALADPPGQVGRISYVEGSVTLQDFQTGESISPSINWPVTADSMISTFGRSRAELRIGSTAIRLEGGAELEIEKLDDHHVVLRLNNGTAIARLRSSDAASEFEFDTASARALPQDAAEFRMEASASTGANVLQVESGRVRFETADASLTVPAGRRAEFVNGDVSMTEAHRNDSFDDWSLARDQHDARATVTYVSSEMTGYEDLDTNGRWQTTVEYGTVWYPYAVQPGWAPYRYGRWVWLQPWGWTWVDNAPWGYAPFHYGRWVEINHRWCWAPGDRVVHPVWAPALVGWVGGHNWSMTVTSGAPAIGWYPLAPRDAFIPSYTVSAYYVRELNAPHMRRFDPATSRALALQKPVSPTQAAPVNRAVTMVPANTFQQGHTVAAPAAQAIRSVVASATQTQAASTPPPGFSAPAARPASHWSADGRPSLSSNGASASPAQTEHWNRVERNHPAAMDASFPHASLPAPAAPQAQVPQAQLPPTATQHAWQPQADHSISPLEAEKQARMAPPHIESRPSEAANRPAAAYVPPPQERRQTEPPAQEHAQHEAAIYRSAAEPPIRAEPPAAHIPQAAESPHGGEKDGGSMHREHREGERGSAAGR